MARKVATIAAAASVESFIVGETAVMKVTVSNTGEGSLDGGTLTATKGELQEGEGYTGSGSEATITSIPNKGKVEVTFEHVTDEQDKSDGFKCDFTYVCGNVNETTSTGSIAVNEAV